MAKRLVFRELPPSVGSFRLLRQYDGICPRPGMHVVLECTKCGDTDRVLPAYLWKAAAKGTQSLSCATCRNAGDPARPRARRVGKTYTHNGITLTLPEWAERTGGNMRSMYVRSKNRDKLPPELRQSDDYIIFGGNMDHPMRYISARPLKAVDKVLDMLRVDVEEALRSSIGRIADTLISDRVRPVLLDLVRSGVLPVPEAQVDPSLPEGHLWATDAGARKEGKTHNPNHHHPYDNYPAGLNATLLDYRRKYGDEQQIDPEWGRWALLESYRIAMEAGGDDSEFAREQYHTMLNEPFWDDDVKAAKAEQERKDAEQKEAEREARIAEHMRKQEEKRAEDAKWTLTCIEQDRPYLRMESEYTLLPDYRIEGGALPVAKGPAKGEIRDGSFLARQADTQPVTHEEEEEQYTRYPWWEQRMRHLHWEYGFGHICHTQYERAVAFYRIKTHDRRLSQKYMVDPAADWLSTHRDLNLYMDLEAIEFWCGADGHFARFASKDNPAIMGRIGSAVEAGLDHRGKPMRELAQKIALRIPELNI